MPALPMLAAEAEAKLENLPGWELAEGGLIITREFRFASFMDALDFVNKVAPLAEAAGHHPDIALGWGYVHIALTTHDAEGLTHKDFDLASKISELL